MTDNRTPVTVLGLGRMGAPIAEIFLRNGHPTTVWNRTADKVIRLEQQGARRAETVTEAVTAGSLVVVAVADTATTSALLTAARSALAGRTVLNVATGRPDQARELAKWIDGHGGRFLDAGILGVPQTLATPDTTIMYSGSPEAQVEFGDVIAELGTAKYLGTDAGMAGLHDMAILAGMYGLFAGMFQSVAMIDTEQGTAVDFTKNFLAPWLRSIIDVLPALAAEIEAGDYPVNFSDLAANQAGLANILISSRNQGVATDLLDPLQRLFDEQLEQGHGAASFTRAVAGLREKSVAASG